MFQHQLNLRAAARLDALHKDEKRLDGGAWDVWKERDPKAHKAFEHVIIHSSKDQLKAIVDLCKLETRDYARDCISTILWNHEHHMEWLERN